MNSLPYGSSRELDIYDIVAIVLSVLVPGLGHVMLGQTAKGVLILALVVASCGVGLMLWQSFNPSSTRSRISLRSARRCAGERSRT